MEIKIVSGDITKFQVDAIVNAANNSLLGGGGVDGAIHRVAGPSLLEDCRKLNGCPTGEARVTKGYNLPAKYVIHTVGPIWSGGDNDEYRLLEDCYINSLKMADALELSSVAFPNISTGVYRFPLREAAEIAIKTVSQFKPKKLDTLYFVCFNKENEDIYKQILSI